MYQKPDHFDKLYDMKWIIIINVLLNIPYESVNFLYDNKYMFQGKGGGVGGSIF